MMRVAPATDRSPGAQGELVGPKEPIAGVDRVAVGRLAPADAGEPCAVGPDGSELDVLDAAGADGANPFDAGPGITERVDAVDRLSLRGLTGGARLRGGVEWNEKDRHDGGRYG